MIKIGSQSGFTAIELLITLFVAAAFLIAGYQLFNVVIKDGGQARSESRAGNVAYDYMRRYSASATLPCSPQTLLTDSALSIDGLTNPRISVSITCPDYTTTSLSKISVTLTYNSPQETVKYATFVNGTGAQATNITDGLVAWWKLNGDATTSVGTVNGVANGAVPAQDKNGIENRAYSFNGVNSYIDFSSIASLSLTDSITLSMWAYPRVGTDGIAFATTPGSSSNRIVLLIPTSSLLIGDYGTDTTGRVSVAWSSGWQNQWSYFTFISSPATGKKLYRNSVEIASASGSVSFNPSGMGARLGLSGTGLTPLNGVLDDVRIYNRALSPTEIATIYNGGPQ